MSVAYNCERTGDFGATRYNRGLLARPKQSKKGSKAPPKGAAAANLDPSERKMFEGLLRSLVAAEGSGLPEDLSALDEFEDDLDVKHADVDLPEAEALGENVDPDAPPLPGGLRGGPTAEQLAALEAELEEEPEEDIDDAELVALLAGGDDDEPLPGAPVEGGGGPAALLALLGSLAAEPEPEPEPPGQETPAQLIHRALDRTLTELFAAELVELTHPAHREDLVEQMMARVLAAPSFNQALRAALDGLVESEHVEEVYGDDAELLGILRRCFDAVNREATAKSDA